MNIQGTPTLIDLKTGEPIVVVNDSYHHLSCVPADELRVVAFDNSACDRNTCWVCHAAFRPAPYAPTMVLSILHDSLTSAIRAKAASEHEQEITE